MAGCEDDELKDPGEIEFYTLNNSLTHDTGNITIIFGNYYNYIPEAKFHAAIEGLTKDSFYFTYESNNGRYVTVNSISEPRFYEGSAAIDINITRSAADGLKGLAYIVIVPSAGYSFIKAGTGTINAFWF